MLPANVSEEEKESLGSNKSSRIRLKGGDGSSCASQMGLALGRGGDGAQDGPAGSCEGHS